MPDQSRLARDRLQRLRLRLTVLFTCASAIGLAVLATTVTIADSNLREDRLVADLHGRAQEATNSLYQDYDTGRIDTEGVRDDPRFTRDAPQVYGVNAAHVSSSGKYEVVFEPDEPWIGGLSDQLLGLAATSVEQSTPNNEARPSMRADVGGNSYYAVAHPIWGDGDTPIGAAVVLSGAADNESQHRTLVTTVWIGSALLIAASAASGYWLAGRSIRPAASALELQEQFLTDAAHELRTPVAAIRATAEAAEEGAEPADEAVGTIARLAGKTGNVIDDLLTLARMDAGAFEIALEPLRLDQLAEDVAEDFPGVAVDVEPATVTGDHRLLSRLVRNLIENAVRHGRRDDPGVTISVRVRPGLLEVADTGPGIDPELRAHLFDRFRSRTGSGGSGLGLAIVAWVAAAHGASLEVLPVSPHGTKFIVRFGR